MRQRILQFLQAPYPSDPSLRKVLIDASVAALCVAAVLNLFQPFGLVNFKSDYKRLILCLFALPTFLSILLVAGISSQRQLRRSERTWVLWKQLSNTAIIVVCIALGNFLLSTLFFNNPFTINGLLLMVGYTLTIGFVPSSIIIVLDWIILFQRHNAMAIKLNAVVLEAHKSEAPTDIAKRSFPPAASVQALASPEAAPESTPFVPSPSLPAEGAAGTSSGTDATRPSSAVNEALVLEGENRDERLELHPDSLLFASSEANYVELFIDEGQAKPQARLLRTTLQKLEAKLLGKHPQLLRVHRSYLVNLRRVTQVSGNAQGLLLTLEKTPEQVPVSRSYVKAFRASYMAFAKA